jgi:hypothetical protein
MRERYQVEAVREIKRRVSLLHVPRCGVWVVTENDSLSKSSRRGLEQPLGRHLLTGGPSGSALGNDERRQRKPVEEVCSRRSAGPT